MIQGVELTLLEDAEEDVDLGAKTLVLSGTAIQEVNRAGWTLIADSGPEKGQQIPINVTTEVGRALECDISILEPSLSRKHAKIKPVDGKLLIRDLGSSNGTYVNGEKIRKAELKHDDVLRFSRIKFIVQGPTSSEGSV